VGGGGDAGGVVLSLAGGPATKGNAARSTKQQAASKPESAGREAEAQNSRRRWTDGDKAARWLMSDE